MEGILITAGVLGAWALTAYTLLWFNHRANKIRKGKGE